MFSEIPKHPLGPRLHFSGTNCDFGSLHRVTQSDNEPAPADGFNEVHPVQGTGDEKILQTEGTILVINLTYRCADKVKAALQSRKQVPAGAPLFSGKVVWIWYHTCHMKNANQNQPLRMAQEASKQTKIAKCNKEQT